MFAETLESVMEKVEGALGAVIMGMDGIAIEKRFLDEAANLESLAAEYTSLLHSSCTSAPEMGLGTLEEFITTTSNRLIVIHMITPEYFLLVILSKTGNLGRARFELKKAKYMLAKEMAV
jgi:predicted regulator of Ras-like GTPase activity (Roadblock/LC7/MglB family)